jgi:putative oxidoreductase
MRDLGLLLLRLTVGGLLAGHGAQKLFGAFEGHGIEGTGKFFERMGLAPGERWAFAAGLGEMGGGLLTALGFLFPIGPMTMLGTMAVAWGRAHWGKPIWATSGGAELPLTNMAVATALILIGPGRFSLDHLFGTRMPPAVSVLTAAGVAAGTLLALNQPRPEPAQPPQESQPQPQPAAHETGIAQ